MVEGFQTILFRRQVEVGLHERVQAFFALPAVQTVLHESAEREGGVGDVLAPLRLHGQFAQLVQLRVGDHVAGWNGHAHALGGDIASEPVHFR